MKFALLLLFVCFFASAFAQSTWVKYAPEENMFFNRIVQSTDGNYLVIGSKNSSCFLIQSDDTGAVNYRTSLTLSESNPGYLFAEDVATTKDNHYVIAGEYSTTGTSVGYAFLTKFDNKGNVIWTKYYPDNNNVKVISVNVLHDGFLVLTEGSGSKFSTLMKTDAEGNPVWVKVLNDKTYSLGKIILTPDGGFIVALGYLQNIAVIKFSHTGNIAWERNYSGEKDLSLQDFNNSPEGMVIAANVSTDNGKASVIIRSDAHGKVMASASYSGVGFEFPGQSILAMQGGSVFLLGNQSTLLKVDGSGNILSAHKVVAAEDFSSNFFHADKSNDHFIIMAGGYKNNGSDAFSGGIIAKLSVRGLTDCSGGRDRLRMQPYKVTEDTLIASFDTPAFTVASLKVKAEGDQPGLQILCESDVLHCAHPVADFSYDLHHLEATFTNQSQNATGWHWDFGDGSSSNDQSPTHEYADGGDYNVCLIASNDCGNDTLCRNVVIECGTVSADFSYEISNLEVSFTSKSEHATSYHWDFGDGSSSSDQNPTHNYKQGGTYNVCLVASNGCSSDTNCQEVIINCSTVSADFSFEATDFDVSFTAKSEHATTYHWDFGDGASSSDKNPVHHYGEGGTYYVCFVASNGCSSDTACEHVTVECTNLVPEFSFEENGDTVSFTDKTEHDINWLWDFGDGTTSHDKNPMHVYSKTGTYKVCLTVSNSCYSAYACNDVNILATGTYEVMSVSLTADLFPNPFGDQFNLTVKSNLPVQLVIFDISGKLIESHNDVRGTFRGGEKLGLGVYIAQVSVEGGISKTIKLVKAK